jgi:hypothetical protein
MEKPAMRSEMHLDDYIDAAIKAQRLTSDRELGRRLGCAGVPVTQWRTKRTWPSDEAMIHLAQLAKLDPVKALIDLNIWRAKSESTRGKYEEMRDRVLAAILIVFVAFSAIPSAAIAGEREGYRSAPAFPLLYIMRHFAAALARRLGRFFGLRSGCCATI